MSIEVTNETVWDIDTQVFSQIGVWVLAQMGVSIHCDLTIIFVDPEPIAQLHERWMQLEGPTDVMSFPMDELRPFSQEDDNEQEAVLGDIVLCPWVAAQQAYAAGHSVIEEMLVLTVHGILHLLGYDHADAQQERDMFSLQRQLLITFIANLDHSLPEASLPSDSVDELALYEQTHEG